nr:hypothetical protein [Micromonospora sp. DSM 115978]
MATRDPQAPGPFALSDPDAVNGILCGSGWTGIDVDPVDVACTLPESELVGYITRLGPVGVAFRGRRRDPLEGDRGGPARVRPVRRWRRHLLHGGLLVGDGARVEFNHVTGVTMTGAVRRVASRRCTPSTA